MSAEQVVAEHTDPLGVTDTQQLRIRETNPHDDPRWEAFVLGHPSASIYHHPAWLAALEHEYPQKTMYLICENTAGEIQGLFPLMYTRGIPFSKRGPLGGARLASLPRTPLAGPLALSSQACTLLLKEAIGRVATQSSLRLQIKPIDRNISGLVDNLAEKPWRFTYILPIQNDSGEPIRFANSKHRTRIVGSVRKALSNGLRPRFAETEADLAGWYRTYLESMRRNAVPARPYRFFLALWRLMADKGMMKVWLAEHHSSTGTRIVAGHVYFRFGKKISYAFNGALTSALPLRPNDILLWESINEAHRCGCQSIDLGEVPDGDETLAQYKLKWGAKPVQLFRYYFPDVPAEPVSDTIESPLAVRAKSIWTHLPLGFTAWLSDRIYSHL